MTTLKANKWLVTTTWLLPEDCLTTNWQLLTTAWKLQCDCLTTACCLPKDCLTSTSPQRCILPVFFLAVINPPESKLAKHTSVQSCDFFCYQQGYVIIVNNDFYSQTRNLFYIHILNVNYVTWWKICWQKHSGIIWLNIKQEVCWLACQLCW
jgi:hypothetical protein